MASAQLSPFMAPNNPQRDELHFSEDPDFALHGQIMMLVFVLVFALFLVFLLFLLYVKRPQDDLPTKLGEPELNQSVPIKIAATTWGVKRIYSPVLSNVRITFLATAEMICYDWCNSNLRTWEKAALLQSQVLSVDCWLIIMKKYCEGWFLPMLTHRCLV